jgi:thymidylate kinase
MAGLASVGKRIVKQGSAPGVRAVASGDAASLPSRKGVLGWCWTAIVTLSFIYDVRVQMHRARGVVLFDRYLLDALATLEFVYQGVNLRFSRFLVRHFLPRAALTVYLDVPADVAVSRKPGDTFGQYAVETQLDAYAGQLGSLPDVLIVDGCRPTSDIANEVLLALTDPSA